MRSQILKTALRLTTTLSLFLLAGCITTVTSRREAPGMEGQGYALPLPLIEVIPQADGTLAVAVKYVADPNNRYVISASSFLSSYTLDVQTDDDGLLKSVSLDAKSAEVAADLLKAAGEVRKAELAAKAKDEDEAATAATAANKTLNDAQLALNKADAKLQTLIELAKDPNNKIEPKDVVAAQVAVVEARVTRDAAAAAVAKSADKSAMDAGNGGFSQAWGPVYYRVAVKPDAHGKPLSVKLIPATFPALVGGAPKPSAQLAFDTSEVGKPAAPEPQVPRLAIKGDKVLKLNAKERYQLTLEVADGPLTSVDERASEVRNDKSVRVGTPSLNLQAAGTAIVASFDSPGEAGEYTLNVAFGYGKGKTHKREVAFEIR
jgi:hypothetical protein